MIPLYYKCRPTTASPSVCIVLQFYLIYYLPRGTWYHVLTICSRRLASDGVDAINHPFLGACRSHSTDSQCPCSLYAAKD